MSSHNSSFWDHTWRSVFLLTILSIIAWASYGIWHSTHQPYHPLDPRQEFVNSCEFDEAVPNVQVSPWTCTRP